MESKRTFSGKFMVRIPPYLHEKLAKAADDQGVSINSLVQICLAEAITRLSADKKLRRVQRQSSEENPTK